MTSLLSSRHTSAGKVGTSETVAALVWSSPYEAMWPLLPPPPPRGVLLAASEDGLPEYYEARGMRNTHAGKR